MTQEELQKTKEYARKMFLRGDGYINIANYLDRQGANEELKKDIFIELDKIEKKTQQKDLDLYPISIPAIIIGVAFFSLTCYLWKLQAIAFPWSLLGIIMGLAAVKEIVKLALNVIKKRKNKE